MKTRFKLSLLLITILGAIFLLNPTNVKAFIEDGSGIVTDGTVTEEIIQNIPDTIKVDIPEVEYEKVDEAIYQKVVELLKNQGIIIEKKDYTEYKDGDVKLEIYKDYLEIDKAVINFRQIGTDWEKQIGQKEVKIEYTNHGQYNEEDKNYIEEAFIKIGFSNKTYYINEYSELNVPYNGSQKLDEIIKEMNNMGVVVKVIGTAAGPEIFSNYGEGSLLCFKDDVCYGYLARVIINTQYTITVPYSIPNTEKDYIDYALPKIQNYVNESGLLGDEEKGIVTLQKENEDTYKVYSAGNYIGNIVLRRAEAPKTISITKCTISGITNQTYTSKEIKPTIIIKNGNTTLKNGTNYVLNYKNNINVGTATITITGKGKYEGAISKTFKITAKPITKCTITIANQNYTGKALKPNPTIKNGKIVLKNGKDYIVSYKSNKNLGTATATIKGKGNYTGTVSKTFKIVVGKTKGIAVKTQSTSSITIKWNRDTAVTGYEVYMATSKNGKYTKVATIKKNSITSYKKTKLSAGKTYYFKVRAYKTTNGKTTKGSYSTILITGTKTKTPSISKVTAGSKKATVKWKKVSGASGYEIYMATSKNGKYKKVGATTKNNAISYTKKDLKKGKKYYFKVRTYKTVDGKKIYSSYSTIKDIKVK